MKSPDNDVPASLTFEVDGRIYPLVAVQKTLYWFTGRFFVSIQRVGESRISIAVRGKDPGADLKRMQDDFLNALLDQTLREKLARETEPVRNLIMAHALSKTVLVNADFETADPVVDPHRISRPDALKQAPDAES